MAKLRLMRIKVAMFTLFVLFVYVILTQNIEVLNIHQQEEIISIVYNNSGHVASFPAQTKQNGSTSHLYTSRVTSDEHNAQAFSNFSTKLVSFNSSNKGLLEHNNITVKTILLWTWLYRRADFGFGYGTEPFLARCGVSNCRTTSNRSELVTADAVVFFIYGMVAGKRWEDLRAVLPQKAHKDQAFVFWEDEPPIYGTRHKLGSLRGVFNMSITYRRDSTLFLPVHRVVNRTKLRTPQTNITAIMSKKSRLVAWVVSACYKQHTSRLDYARILQKYIPVDIYGACGNLSLNCPAGNPCVKDLQHTYKFYLAFENSACVDYITEKAFRTLEGYWVPVVLGGRSYHDRLPPHSYIDVREFSHVRKLAEYLLYLDSHDAEYLKYFEWKSQYQIQNRDISQAFCTICAMLHNNSSLQFEKDYDVEKWWEQETCDEYWSLRKELHLDDDEGARNIGNTSKSIE